MVIQPASCQPGLVRGTVIFLENSITVWIVEQHKRMEVITQQLYVSNCIEGGWMERPSRSLEVLDRSLPGVYLQAAPILALFGAQIIYRPP
ncbi:hypothetical protein TNCV_838131 [Trichonephila clavipes]|nr:hypothetical protein TNCV_838131 [Trichonephila clavipes]